MKIFHEKFLLTFMWLSFLFFTSLFVKRVIFSDVNPSFETTSPDTLNDLEVGRITYVKDFTFISNQRWWSVNCRLRPVVPGLIKTFMAIACFASASLNLFLSKISSLDESNRLALAGIKLQSPDSGRKEVISVS